MIELEILLRSRSDLRRNNILMEYRWRWSNAFCENLLTISEWLPGLGTENWTPDSVYTIQRNVQRHHAVTAAIGGGIRLADMLEWRPRFSGLEWALMCKTSLLDNAPRDPV